MADEDRTAKVAELLKGKRACMMTTTDGDGTLQSRPMALQASEFNGDLWFFTERDSRKVQQLAIDPQVNVTVADSSEWISLTGSGVVVDDVAKKRELWNGVVGVFFPDGPDDDGIVLLKVEASSAEYWDTPGGRVASMISFVKAKATGQPYQGGTDEKVSL